MPVERAVEDPGRLHARARSGRLPTCTARHCCQTIDAASVTTSVTMISAVSSAAPCCRWGACRLHGSGTEQRIAGERAVQAAARRESEHDPHPRRRRARGAAALAGSAGAGAARLPVDARCSRNCPGRSRPATGHPRACAADPARRPAVRCWLVNQLSCSAALPVTAGLAQRSQALASAAASTTRRPPARRRAARCGMAASRHRTPAAARRQCALHGGEVGLPLRQHSVQAQCLLELLSLASPGSCARCRPRPARPCQQAISAMMTRATSTWTRVKPRVLSIVAAEDGGQVSAAAAGVVGDLHRRGRSRLVGRMISLPWKLRPSCSRPITVWETAWPASTR